MKALRRSPLLWLALASGTASGQGVDEVVQKLQAKYETIQSFSAQFEQVFRSRNVEHQESGIVMMKRPGKMYWEYQKPTPKYFVSTGKKTYFYVPRDKQVMVADLTLGEAGTPLLFLLGRGDLKKEFEVQFEAQEQPRQVSNVLLRLAPKQPQPDFSYLILEVIPSTSLIHRLAVIEPIGNRNDYVLTNFQENVKIPDRQFEFKLPRGVEVIKTDH